MVVGEFTQEADLIIIGAGPGGYSAAFRAASLGVRTVLVDKRDALGGVCLHAGCIPSKTLLYVSELIRTPEYAAALGVQFDRPKIDVARIREWIDQTVHKLAGGLASRAKSLGVERLTGAAVFDDNKNLGVHGESHVHFKFRRAIIATGSKTKPHPVLSFDDDRVLDPWQALRLERVPERLLIVGAQSFTVEIACIYSALGSKVTLVAEGDQLIEHADADLIRPLERRLKKRYESIALNTRIVNVDDEGEALKVTFEGEKPPADTVFDMVIVATAQEPNVEALNLKNANVACDENGFIIVDEQMKTSNTRVLAVGDVTGPPWLADRAIGQGKVAAEVVAGWNSIFDARAVPYVAFTDPQVAWCGLTEQNAKEQGIPVRVAKLPWGASGRAVGMNHQDGLTKIIYDPDTKMLLGVGIVGTSASEMIGEGALAIEMGCELDDVSHTIHPHPSIIELMSDAAMMDE